MLNYVIRVLKPHYTVSSATPYVYFHGFLAERAVVLYVLRP